MTGVSAGEMLTVVDALEVDGRCKVLMEKNPATLKAAKHAYRRVLDISWDDAEDYLFAKID